VTSAFPVDLPAPFSDPIGLFGDDGTYYAASRNQIMALDPLGHPISRWAFRTSSPEPISTLSLGPDRSLYVAEGDALTRFLPNAEIAAGWPVTLSGMTMRAPAFLPSGRLVMSATDGSSTIVSVVGQDGSVATGWPITLSGGLFVSPAIAKDGSFALTLQGQGIHASIVIFGSTASSTPTTRLSSLDGIEAFQSDSFIGWSYDTTATPDGLDVNATTLLVVDANGTAQPGWPVIIRGPSSVPAIGTDGQVFLSLGDGRPGRNGTIAAYGPSAQSVRGWPVALHGSMGLPSTSDLHGLRTAQPPVPTADGGVILVVDDGMRQAAVTYTGDGSMVDGWPYKIPNGFAAAVIDDVVPTGQGPTPPLVTPDGSSALVVRSSANDEVIALDGHGLVLPGYPWMVDGDYRVSLAQLTSAGLGLQELSDLPSTKVDENIISVAP
jgi:hypothetical protein